MVKYNLRIWVYKELFGLTIIFFLSILLGSMTIIKITCPEWEILVVRSTYEVWKHIPWLDNIIWSANVSTCCRWVRKQLWYSRLAMTSPDLPHTDLELSCFHIPVSQTMDNIRQFSGDPPSSKVVCSNKHLVRKDITCVIVGVELKLIPKPSKEKKNCQYFNMESSAAINVL